MRPTKISFRTAMLIMGIAVAVPAGAQLAPRDSARADSIVWLGRRVAYLGLHREAISVYTKGLELFPDEPHLLRHRGHREISVRDFPSAERDLARAGEVIAGKPDEIEPDGQPNAANTPVSSLHFNIWYHLGLVRWLQGDAAGAATAYERCLAVSKNDDSRVAARYWLWQIYHRLGRPNDAAAMARAARTETRIIENGAYAKLLALFDGTLPVDSVKPRRNGASAQLEDATTGYGLGAWHRANGRNVQAAAAWKDATNAVAQRASFGYIAAEAELARLEKLEKPSK